MAGNQSQNKIHHNITLNQNHIPTSMELIQNQHIPSTHTISSHQSLTNNQPNLYLHNNSSHRSPQTIESINYYQHQNSRELSERRQKDQTSLQIIRENKHKVKPSPANSLASLAKSITDELSLHYDYYYPPEDSDRSLSVTVTL